MGRVSAWQGGDPILKTVHFEDSTLGQCMAGREPILKTAGAQVHGFNPELRCFFPINSPAAGTLSGLLRKQYENLFSSVIHQKA